MKFSQTKEGKAQRKNAGTGPWSLEPYKIQWIDKTTGFPCMALRGPVGSWNGYVGVPKSSSLHGKHYNEVDVVVHGGLTHSGDWPMKFWCFGFDCSHWNDKTLNVSLRGWQEEPIYRDVNYIVSEIKNLVRELKKEEISILERETLSPVSERIQEAEGEVSG